MIGVIVPKISSTSVARVVEGILSTLNERGYQMLLAVAQSDPAKELEYLHAFHSKQVDGVVLNATIFTPEHKRVLKDCGSNCLAIARCSMMITMPLMT